MNIDSLLTGDNAAFLDAQYTDWLQDPSNVDPEWAQLFEQLDRPAAGQQPGRSPSFAPRSIFNPSGPPRAEVGAVDARLASRVPQLINAYRVRGHMVASIDPLGKLAKVEHPEMTKEYYGLTDADLDVPVASTPLYGEPTVSSLRRILSRLRRSYSGALGVEFMNIHDLEQKLWLQRTLETIHDGPILTHEQERRFLEKLSDAEGFERTLHTRFPGTKRFSLEGAESLIPLLDLLINDAAADGVREIIVGMAHRGRLNVLVNIMEKPVGMIVDEFQGTSSTEFEGSGDVKYHLGYSTDAVTFSGDKVHLNMAFNPSHLEAVNPVVEGRVRAKHDRWAYKENVESYKLCMPLLLHGDAAFAGQGLVAETLNLSDLAGYRTGGTVHIIVNNQIGFTTQPKDARSTPYATDVARMLGVPIFHVNGEDPEAVAIAVRVACAWRQTFHRDVVIDMYCFRKHGHNEGDEPSFTQPLLYEAIKSHPTAREVYSRKLIAAGRFTQEETDRIYGESKERMAQADDEDGRDSYMGNAASDMGKLWRRFKGQSLRDPVDTRFDIDRLKALLERANTIPEDFNAHAKIKRLLKQRRQVVSGERPVSWAEAEQAAFASLVVEGFRVRLSGQDSGRGTFSHRHAVLTDVKTGKEYFPVDHLEEGQARFQVMDSLLSEAAVLGFEYGYSLDTPDGLVLWEAQFGDFANGAQVIIDQFIVAGEQKWNRCSGLVMLLPHGYEGQGPEHSSARMERYIMMCAEDNIQIANCTTPANFYHLLRRQCLRKARKPLVVFTPKSLLRHAQCVSTLEDLAEGGFQPVLGEVDPLVDSSVSRVVFCQGKVYYELLNARRERDIQDIALVRVEELYPFPSERILEELGRYPDSAEVVWAQEEPRNMGAWPMYDEWLGDALTNDRRLGYAGRKPAASPATGSSATHKREHAAMIEAALGER